MKKRWICIILIFFEIALAMAFGFLLQDIMPIELCFAIAFLVPLFVICVSSKKSENIWIKLIEVLVLSFLSMALFMSIYICGNEVYGEYIDEYEVVVEFVDGRGGGYADFTTPRGTKGSVGLHDYRLVMDDDDYVAVGDTIRVREYKGLFKKLFYVFVEEIQ